MGDASEVVGGITGDMTDLFRTIYSNQPGMYTYQSPDGSVTTYRQPEGSTTTLPVGNITGQLGTSVSGSSSGVWILLAVAAAFIFFGGGKR